MHWLYKHVLSEPEPRPLLWIAHHADLLTQAARTFERFLGVGTRRAPLTLRTISGAHGKPVTALGRGADVSLATIQSLSRRPDIVEHFFRRNRDCFVVVDEAHHAAARTYQEVLSIAGRYRKSELLGLTATPTRMVEEEIGFLKKVFRQGIIYQARLVDLIEKRILSRPVLETVHTNFDFDRDLTAKELRDLRRFGDFTPKLLNKIGKHAKRNKLVVSQYLKHRRAYGQTLVFAADIAHCYTLAKEFTRKGVRTNYVASARHDRSTTEEVIQDFHEGRIEVLVNVMMLTEGVDLPRVQSVFLARPTASEILLRQMVGRGMRGPKAGGREKVFIVSFADHWERFPGWLDPISVLDIEAEPQREERRYQRGKLVGIPWELISAAGELAPYVEPSLVTSLIPVGWYHFKYHNPELGQASAILVFEQQKAAYERFIRDSVDNHYVLSGPGGAAARYFGDVPDPRPSNDNLKNLHAYIMEFGRPKYVSFDQKAAFEPEVVARKYRRLPADELVRKAEALFEATLAGEYYSTKERYAQAVLSALGDVIMRVPPPVDRPITQPVARTKRLPPGSWPLERIRDEVREQMRLSMPAPAIAWSKRPLSSSWGFYRYGDQRIVINSALKTSAVGRNTIAFLVYHELLHHEFGHGVGHGTVFRERERQFPGCIDAEAELDTLRETYRIPGMRVGN